MHQQWPPRICERCGQRFVVESTFQRHMKHCGKMGVHAFNRICKNLASLEKHQVNCRKVPSSSKCDICEKNFAHRSNLNRHMKLHERGTAHKCEVCHISYARQADLKRHMLRHDENQASFACTVCDKVYQQKYLLSRHMVVHTKEGRFQCSICDQTFSQKSALKNHAKVHAKIKAFQCPDCLGSFSTVGSLKRHRENLHGLAVVRRVAKADLTLQCEMCDQSFANFSNVKRHIKERHGGILKCAYCDKVFATTDELKLHSRTQHSKRRGRQGKENKAGEESKDTEVDAEEPNAGTVLNTKRVKKENLGNTDQGKVQIVKSRQTVRCPERRPCKKKVKLIKNEVKEDFTVKNLTKKAHDSLDLSSKKRKRKVKEKWETKPSSEQPKIKVELSDIFFNKNGIDSNKNDKSQSHSEIIDILNPNKNDFDDTFEDFLGYGDLFDLSEEDLSEISDSVSDIILEHGNGIQVSSPPSSCDASAVELRSDKGYSEQFVWQNHADTNPIVLESPNNNPDTVSTCESINYSHNVFHERTMIDKAASSDGQSDASSDTDISLPSNNSIANAETDDIGLNSDFFTAGIVYADMMNVNAADRAFDMYLQSTGAELCLPSAPIDSIQLRIIATDNVSSNLSMSSNESIEATTPCPNVASNGGSHGHQYDICSDMDVHNGEHSKEDSSAECTDESEIVNSTQEMYPLSCYTSQDSYVPNNDLSENPYVNKEKAYFSPCDDDDASDSRSRCGSSTFRNELEGSHTTVFDFPSCETEQDHNQEDSSNDSTRWNSGSEPREILDNNNSAVRLLLDLIQATRDNDKIACNDKDEYKDEVNNNDNHVDDGGCHAAGLEQAFAIMQTKVGNERQCFLELNHGFEENCGDIQEQDPLRDGPVDRSGLTNTHSDQSNSCYKSVVSNTQQQVSSPDSDMCDGGSNSDSGYSEEAAKEELAAEAPVEQAAKEELAAEAPVEQASKEELAAEAPVEQVAKEELAAKAPVEQVSSFIEQPPNSPAVLLLLNLQRSKQQQQQRSLEDIKNSRDNEDGMLEQAFALMQKEIRSKLGLKDY